MNRDTKGHTIYYLAPGDVLKGRVEPILWVRTCEWFARAGNRVTLTAPYYYRRENIRKKELFRHFGVEPLFRVRILPTPVSKIFSRLAWIRFWYFTCFFLALFPAVFRKERIVFYSKGNICMQVVLLLEKISGRRFFKIYELHALFDDPRLFRMLRRMDLVIANSKVVRGRLSEAGIDPARTILLYNAPFAGGAIVDKTMARQKLDLPRDMRIATYAGKLYDEIVGFIIESALLLKDENFQLHVVGGNPEILRTAEELRASRNVGNVIFHGFRAPSEVALYLSASDYLFCSYSNSHPNIEQATPAKYFDYLCAGRPIFCSGNTAIGEIFSDLENCVFFRPEDPRDFVSKLLAYAGEEEALGKMVARNLELSKRFNWKDRTESILSRIPD